MKPVVRYKAKSDCLLIGRIGSHAIVIPVDHPSHLVSNTMHVLTSEIVSKEENGCFETRNTRYVPQS